ncbi:hypothetical protein [Streptomyces endophytica]|uniref:Transposase n=1 Tax=Streptomyces endophytica TaxID=2991496 RepID=A0ABY6P6S5_9ACTN|nr:hypothetical protein [Streptomyces endophytica]UZJ29489.1 hypothetical protein OJ254_02075 [Streptomyces endophytica]
MRPGPPAPRPNTSPSSPAPAISGYGSRPLPAREQREAGLNALVETARDLTLPYTLHALLKVITRRARLLLHVDMSYISFPTETDGDPAATSTYTPRTARPPR